MSGREAIRAEMHRLSRRGAHAEAPPRVLGRVKVDLDPEVDPLAYLERLTDVLSAAVSLAESASFDEDALREDIIPEWFSRVTSTDLDVDLAESVEMRGRRRYQEFFGEEPWSLQEWLFSFDPDRRHWSWWSGSPGDHKVILWVDTRGEPVVASHSLIWLAYVAGATRVGAIELCSTDDWAVEDE